MLRRMRLLHWALAFLAVDAAAIGFVACGARTGLPVGERDETGEEGGGPPDAGRDAPDDVPQDVPEDVVPDCVDPSTQYIYLVTSEYDLYSLNPKNNAFSYRGALSCPTLEPGATPFSMGVDRKGTAYVVYNDGELFRVSTKDASCEATDFTPNQFGFNVFGMGFALEPDGMSDQLFVAEINFAQPSLGLGRIDTESLELSYVGPFSENLGNALEMTSSSDGNLYGYFLDLNGGGWVVSIDKTDATILEKTFLPVGENASALAFAFWGGDFFVFTSPGGTTDVTRYRPSDGTVTLVTTLDRTVVGAGVSTCAPQ